MGFDISRLRRSDQIMGGGAIAFFIFLFFFKWYGVSSSGAGIAGVNLNVTRSGWDTFTNSRWIWLITIIVALGAVLVTATQAKIELPVKPGVIVAALGALSTALILYRIIHHPTASASFGNFHASVGIKIGIWLGLIAAAVTTYGGYLAMHEEGTSITQVREQASDAFKGLSTPSAAAGSTGAESPLPPSPMPPTPPPAEPAPPAAGPPIPPPAAPAGGEGPSSA
jgi:hypothetical protein